jgi:Xaa-Pro dipeptidase
VIPRDLAFTAAEYEGRLARVRAGMAARGLDALLVFSPGSINYLSGLDDNSPTDLTCLVVPQDRDPVLVLFWFEAGRAANSAWVSDVRLWRAPNDPSPGAGPIVVVADAVRGVGMAGARLGVEVGPGALSPAEHAELVALLPDAVLADSWPVVETVRRVKSAAEIAYMRDAAAITDAAIDAGTRAVREGARDTDVGAAILSTLIGLGSETPCQGPIIAAGFRSGAPHSSLARAVIRRGDAVFLELTAQIRRYCAPLMRTVIVGEPSAEQRRAAEAGARAVEVVVETARPGVAAADVARAAGAVVAPFVGEGGLMFHGNFGYTVGIGYPPSWSERLGFQLRPDNPLPLEAGMTFHLPVSLRRFGEWGICQSHTLLITETGAEPLTRSEARLQIIEAGDSITIERPAR